MDPFVERAGPRSRTRILEAMRFVPLLAFGFTIGALTACAADAGDAAGTGGDGGTTGGANATGGASSGGGTTTATGGGTSGSGGTNLTGGSSNGTGGAMEPSCTPSSGAEDVGAASFLDRATCLTWQKTNTYVGAVVNRDGAAHCEGLTQDGFDDWRLPTAQELRTYPNLPDAGNAYLAGPIYIPTNASSEMEGCTGNSHSCNLTQYSPGNFACAWQGPGANSYGLLCVRGEAAVPLDATLAVATCCSASSTYRIADCSAF